MYILNSDKDQRKISLSHSLSIRVNKPQNRPFIWKKLSSQGKIVLGAQDIFLWLDNDVIFMVYSHYPTPRQYINIEFY